jgi:hypothetical protein
MRIAIARGEGGDAIKDCEVAGLSVAHVKAGR